jgi:hypothetical protein
MNRTAFGFLAILALFAADGLAQDPNEALRVYLKRVGPFRIGMTLDQARVVAPGVISDSGITPKVAVAP